MFMIKFMYDLMVFITTNYSEMPDKFKERFSETDCVNARQIVFDVYDADSKDFADYE